MRKFRTILALALVMLMAVAVLPACSSQTAESDKTFKVALVLPGNVNDAGWSASAYAGLQLIEKDLGAEIAYSEAVAASDAASIFRHYADQGFDVIIGHGYEYGDIAMTVGPEFPDITFLVTSTNIAQAPNVGSMNTLPVENGLLQGTAAAYMTKTKKIGAVGGLTFSSFFDPLNAYAAAAISIDPEIEVMLNVIGSETDAALAKETALSMIDEGADVIMYNANAAGQGALEACKERGVYAIASIKDQNNLAPDVMIGTGVCDTAIAMREVVSIIKDGKFEPKFYSMGVPTGCVYFVPNDAVYNTMSEEGRKAMDDLFDKLMKGEVDPYGMIDQYVPANVKVG
ncbi:MAG: BMP family protein [Bacillota bacterium]